MAFGAAIPRQYLEISRHFHIFLYLYGTTKTMIFFTPYPELSIDILLVSSLSIGRGERQTEGQMQRCYQITSNCTSLEGECFPDNKEILIKISDCPTLTPLLCTVGNVSVKNPLP